MDTKAMIGAVVAVIAIMLLIFSLGPPWYNFTSEAPSDDGEVETSMDFHLKEMEVTVDGESHTYDYNEEGLNEVGSTFSTTELFIMVAIVGSILGLLGSILVGIGKLNPKIGAGLAVIGILFAFLAPIYLWLDLPDAFEEDMDWDEVGPNRGPLYFAGGGSVGQEERTWGPRMGWILPLIVGILDIVVLRLTLASNTSYSKTP